MDCLNLPHDMDYLSGPEKLVICVDAACASSYEFKKILRNFLELKCLVNRHEISLATLNALDVNFVCDFKTDVTHAVNLLGYRYSESSRFMDKPETFDLSQIFRAVYQRANSFRNQKVSLRIIILYSRIDCYPVMDNGEALEALKRDFPLFTLDILYMPMFSSKCPKSKQLEERMAASEIFKVLINITNSKSYVYAVEEPCNVSSYVLNFLAHPAVRDSQKKESSE